MRIIGENVQNEMVLADPVSGSELSFFYTVPTSEDRQAYISSMYKRVGDKVEDHSYETRLKYGKKILTGIGEGQFGFQAEGEVFQISSDPESKHYRADWKELLEQYVPEMLWFLAFRVFEGASQITPGTARGDEAYDSKN